MDSTGIYNRIATLLYDNGLPLADVAPATTIAMLAGSCLIAWIVFIVLSRVVGPLLQRLVRHTNVRWDDTLFNHSLMVKCWRLTALFLLAAGIPASLRGYPSAAEWARTVFAIVLIIATAMVFTSLIRTLFDIIAQRTAEMREKDDTPDYNPALLEERARAQSHSLGGVCQMLQLIVVVVALILSFSVLSGKNVLIILSGLGASAAVLMLVFRDSILGLVAGIQLTANDMLRPGDWISMPGRDVNGRVRLINLTTVKVQNYDNTIVTIPPYILVSETFCNWRGMERSGGRRIMRSIAIDIATVRFCTDEEKRRWHDEPWWRRVANPGQPVNVSAFRAYLEDYLRRQPTLVADMLCMVRELQPTERGLPIEIYFFTSDTEWASYEAIQAAVVDHVLAVAGDFGLRVYQAPSGADFRHC